MNQLRILLVIWLANTTTVLDAGDTQPGSLRKSLSFYASFDHGEHADFARGDKTFYTAQSLNREKVREGLVTDAVRLDQSGKFGPSLRYLKKTTQVTFFKGGRNVAYHADRAYSTTISFWMSLTPDADLPAGYVDPLQITDKKWDDASIFVDFNKTTPRQFRLGVYSDFDFWNPERRKFDTIPESELPLVTVHKPPFRSDRWTHVAIVLDHMNSPQGRSTATLYLDGRPQGTLDRGQRFTWNPENVVVMLGIYYVGGIDDFAMFDRALSREEIQALFELPAGVRSILDATSDGKR